MTNDPLALRIAEARLLADELLTRLAVLVEAGARPAAENVAAHVRRDLARAGL